MLISVTLIYLAFVFIGLIIFFDKNDQFLQFFLIIAKLSLVLKLMNLVNRYTFKDLIIFRLDNILAFSQKYIYIKIVIFLL